MAEIMISNTAAKELKRVHGPELDKLLMAIDNLQTSPRLEGVRILGIGTDERPLYMQRVGPLLRVIYSVDDDARIVTVLRVTRRHELGKRIKFLTLPGQSLP